MAAESLNRCGDRRIKRSATPGSKALALRADYDYDIGCSPHHQRYEDDPKRKPSRADQIVVGSSIIVQEKQSPGLGQDGESTQGRRTMRPASLCRRRVRLGGSWREEAWRADGKA